LFSFFLRSRASDTAFSYAHENSESVALVSGDQKKPKKLATKYKVNKTYGYERYADCLASRDIDAVYIALPNNMHRGYTEGAAEAAVRILCEKPMAVTEQECEFMIDAASGNNVKLMIAYRLHFEMGNLSAIRPVRDGQIGEPRIFRSAFCQQVTPGNSRLQSALGGGPLYDIGVYCINAARYMQFRAPEKSSSGNRSDAARMAIRRARCIRSGVGLRRTRWICGDCVEISAAARHWNSAFCGNDNLARL
jgi:glucose-fructose oxidoreductase